MRTPTIFSWLVGATISALVALVLGLLFTPRPAIPLHLAMPGLSIGLLWPVSAIWMPIGSFVASSLINLSVLLFERRYVCPICRSPNEKLNQFDYWRGHGAHTWHPGGN